jgi:hypothetical protein
LKQTAVHRGIVHVPLRWNSNEQAPKSGALKNKAPRVKHGALIPDDAKNSVILKQFDTNQHLKKAFTMYSKGYLVLKGEGSWDEKPFLAL